MQIRDFPGNPDAVASAPGLRPQKRSRLLDRRFVDPKGEILLKAKPR